MDEDTTAGMGNQQFTVMNMDVISLSNTANSDVLINLIEVDALK